MRYFIVIKLTVLSVILMLLFKGCRTESGSTGIINGPLKVSSDNPRYFADKNGKIVYLTGSHTWANLVDIGTGSPPEPFDYNKYLGWLSEHNHNFFRLWTYEIMTLHSKQWNIENVISIYPHSNLRTGPGNATDGKPKFDLNQFDPNYFNRLRDRVESAGKRGIYVAVMLFEGWSLQFSTNGWKNHPYNPENNINGINGDSNGDGSGLDIYTLSDSRITRLQEKYVKNVIDVVNDLDNVLFEISNENHPPSTAWQYHMIDFIHDYEKQKPNQHPVGMTFQYKGGSNETLYNSPAEWISPNNMAGETDVRNDPPAAEGKKVILYDTDHLGGIWGNQPWVWKTFLRGMNPIFMDTYERSFIPPPADSNWEPIRKNMGYTRRYAEKMNLLKAIPHNEISSTSYCLADPGSEYIIYQPAPDSSFTAAIKKGKYRYEWFNPTSGLVTETGKISVSKESMLFKAPFSGDAVLYLKK